MKKIIFAFAVVVITTLAATNKVTAQKAGSNLMMEAVTALAIDKSTEATKELAKDVVNPKALRHFEKSFKNATGVKWMGLTDGFMARFAHNDIIERIFYHSNGNLAGTLKGYSNNNMPEEIRNEIKYTYGGYAITYVDEASAESVPGITAYIIHLQGINDLKVVRICDGEMDVLFDSEKNAKNPGRF